MKAKRVDSQPPDGYVEWHEWAQRQLKRGLFQVWAKCGFLHFPGERCRHKKKK
jgi:hypothetical protein